MSDDAPPDAPVTMIRWHSHGEADLPDTAEWLTAFEAARARGMAFAKRRGEYLLSRWTAKVALAHRLNLSAEIPTFARFEVRSASDGAPGAFLDGRALPLAISLTDRAGWAVCALADAGAGIGCDLELVEPRSPAFVADYFTATEQRAVAAAVDEEDRQRLANLVWSAKESALKVLRTGLRRDTRSVEVTLAEDAPTAGWSPLSVRTEEGARFPGWWRRYGQFLLTVASVTPTPPPLAIVDPPGIASAVPTHSWMHTLR